MIQDSELIYTSENLTVSIPTEEYIRRFRDADRFIECCRECRNYNRSWACPPFSHDIEPLLRNYRNLLLIATKIIPVSSGLPLAESHRLIYPERKRLELRLLEMEHIYNGTASAFAGTCLYCPEGSCTRPLGLPCRHPEQVRPSLEAYGFDIGRTASELFGIELLWGKDGLLPEYLTLVCGFFHNSDSVSY